jgi:hypothetical protein
VRVNRDTEPYKQGSSFRLANYGVAVFVSAILSNKSALKSDNTSQLIAQACLPSRTSTAASHEH